MNRSIAPLRKTCNYSVWIWKDCLANRRPDATLLFARSGCGFAHGQLLDQIAEITRAFLDPIHSSGLYLPLGSAELASQCIDEALKSGDVSAAPIGRFEGPLMRGVEVVRRLIHAFYDPKPRFMDSVHRFPEHRIALIDCHVGDVICIDVTMLKWPG